MSKSCLHYNIQERRDGIYGTTELYEEHYKNKTKDFVKLFKYLYLCTLELQKRDSDITEEEISFVKSMIEELQGIAQDLIRLRKYVGMERNSLLEDFAVFIDDSPQTDISNTSWTPNKLAEFLRFYEVRDLLTTI